METSLHYKSKIVDIENSNFFVVIVAHSRTW